MANSQEALDLKSKLIAAGIVGKISTSSFELAGVTVQGLDKSVAGYSLQSWLEAWMTANGIYHRSPANSQESPDFFLSPKLNTAALEVKAFDYDASANFDISNFEAFLQLLVEEPYHLNADYLILGYSANSSNEISIKEIWLKKIWEITGPMNGREVRVQVKKKVIYNIRPIHWYSTRSTFRAFGTQSAFLTALYWLLNSYRGAKAAEEWRVNFQNSSGVEITV